MDSRRNSAILSIAFRVTKRLPMSPKAIVFLMGLAAAVPPGGFVAAQDAPDRSVAPTFSEPGQLRDSTDVVLAPSDAGAVSPIDTSGAVPASREEPYDSVQTAKALTDGVSSTYNWARSTLGSPASSVAGLQPQRQIPGVRSTVSASRRSTAGAVPASQERPYDSVATAKALADGVSSAYNWASTNVGSQASGATSRPPVALPSASPAKPSPHCLKYVTVKSTEIRGGESRCAVWGN
jgi:hypothetical protein